ncbi:Protein translocase subunit SecD [Planctomycetaceae bacterium]|nr:Protein translocase subunit SecD [Planctomycetaceae bacterium]
MGDFIRKWHPLLLIVIAIYLAIPKPAPEPGDRFQWPLNAYKWNLGQDLSGGSSLRFKLVQQDLKDAEQSLRELLKPLAVKAELPAPVREKFGALIKGAPLKQDAFTVRAKSGESDDFDLLKAPGLFDEGQTDAARKHYKAWNDASKRKSEKALAGPTIETLYRRLGTSGITELNITPLGDDRLEVKLPKFATSAETARYKELLQATGKLEMRVTAPDKPEFTKLTPPNLPRDEGYKYKWLEVSDPTNAKVANAKEQGGKTWVLIQVIDDWDLGGKDIEKIEPSQSEEGKIAVSFAYKGLAVAKFEDLTTRHNKNAKDPRYIANIIDDKVFGAYSIEGKISGSVQVSGSFTREERDNLINVLKSGSLNVKLELEGEESVGPSEGAEAIKRGMWSFIIAALFVFAFALWLYRGLGVLVIFNLLMIVGLIMGAMAAGMGTLTLPGIAGLVLTFGMAIDGNILINERMREELKKGLSTRAAAEEGFGGAFSAIVDSNITTLLSAIVLYKVGSGPVQGFALTLAIGIVATLYANIPAYRAMIMGALGLKRDLKFSMANLSFLEGRKIDFVAGMKFMIPVCIVASIAGLIMLLSLGSSVLGMEFRGGYAYRVQFKEPLNVESLRSVVENLKDEKGEARYPSYEVQPVFALGETTGDMATRFDFRFPMRNDWASRDAQEVNDEIKQDLIKSLVYSEDAKAEGNNPGHSKGESMLQASGWQSEAADAREITLSCQVEVQWKDATIKERYKDNQDKFWKISERAWENKESAPVDKKQEWFGAVIAGANEHVVQPEFLGTNPSGDTQSYRLTISKITVTDTRDLNAKKEAFKQAMTKLFVQDNERVVLTTKELPPVNVSITRGSYKVELKLSAPVSSDDFIRAGESFQTKVPALGALIITASEAKDGKASTFLIRSSEIGFSADATSTTSFGALDGELRDEVLAWLKSSGQSDIYITQPFLVSTTIGATVAGETTWRAMLAIIGALLILVIYMRLRFSSIAWGIAAIVALTFDVTVTMAALALADLFGADMKIDLVIVAAILTIIGYAINDTIVNFDRIRELLKADMLATGGKTPLKTIINESANQMLTRTVMTGGTTLTSTLIMMILGGPLLRGFSFAIFVGVIMGTFASVFVASPILLLFEKRDRSGLAEITEEEAEEIKPAQEADEPDAKDFEDEDDDKPKLEDKKDEKKEDKKDESGGAAPATA